MSDERIIEDPAHPGWRARIVYDEDHPQPWGDALAPALLVSNGRHRQATLAADVYQPKNGSDITGAWRHLSDANLFERYLRMVHGATNVTRLDGHDMTVIVFDTTDFRTYTGYIGVCDLSGETTEWRAWLDGDVYGVQIQQQAAGTTLWDDGRTEAVQRWCDVESLWGLYGHDYAATVAGELLTENAGYTQ